MIRLRSAYGLFTRTLRGRVVHKTPLYGVPTVGSYGRSACGLFTNPPRSSLRGQKARYRAVPDHPQSGPNPAWHPHRSPRQKPRIRTFRRRKRRTLHPESGPLSGGVGCAGALRKAIKLEFRETPRSHAGAFAPSVSKRASGATRCLSPTRRELRVLLGNDAHDSAELGVGPDGVARSPDRPCFCRCLALPAPLARGKVNPQLVLSRFFLVRFVVLVGHHLSARQKAD
mmetsp:Transcript_34891/g.81547  ORF Transcript_34891/g.81547 Transcript_34891/m.81547 type:complete len:228 (+) Transcript_34891:127-810(+)